MNLAPLSVEDFRRLKERNIGTFQLFQETYHRPTYGRGHLAGPEKNLDWRASSVKTPGKAGGLKRGDRSKRFLLFAYGELQQLKLLHLPVFFFLVPYVEPNFPFSYSYRAYKISSRPETRSCYFTNFFKMFRYLNSAFSF